MNEQRAFKNKKLSTLARKLSSHLVHHESADLEKQNDTNVHNLNRAGIEVRQRETVRRTGTSRRAPGAPA